MQGRGRARNAYHTGSLFGDRCCSQRITLSISNGLLFTQFFQNVDADLALSKTGQPTFNAVEGCPSSSTTVTQLPPYSSRAQQLPGQFLLPDCSASHSSSDFKDVGQLMQSLCASVPSSLLWILINQATSSKGVVGVQIACNHHQTITYK